MGELEHGSYSDECSGMNELEINTFYGFDLNGEPIGSSQPHANSESDNEVDSDQDTQMTAEGDDDHDAQDVMETDEQGTGFDFFLEQLAEENDTPNLHIDISTVSS